LSLFWGFDVDFFEPNQITLPGTNPELPSILLNGHYDVVPVFPELWTFDPFGATINEHGDIIARGAQDMKSSCIQYIEALGQLVKSGQRLLRHVHITFVPDEEIGGIDGAGIFISSDHFKKLNVAVGIDEGLANPTNAFTVFYGERVPWWLSIIAKGPTGHASRFIKDTAVEKLNRVIAKVYQYRSEQEGKLHHGCTHSVAKKLGDVVTLNVTALEAGVKGNASFGGYTLNVIPTEAKAGIDIRIPPHVPLEDMDRLLHSWCEKDVEIKFHIKSPGHYVTSIDKEKNIWWKVFSDALESIGEKIEPEIFPAATDSRFIRQLNIPCFGFSPMKNTSILLHDHDECLNDRVFLNGITILLIVHVKRI